MYYTWTDTLLLRWNLQILEYSNLPKQQTTHIQATHLYLVNTRRSLLYKIRIYTKTAQLRMTLVDFPWRIVDEVLHSPMDKPREWIPSQRLKLSETHLPLWSGPEMLRLGSCSCSSCSSCSCWCCCCCCCCLGGHLASIKLIMMTV